MLTIDVPLVVAENQTLYLLVLGPKLDYDMSGVRTLDELKKWSFDYLINVEGPIRTFFYLTHPILCQPGFSTIGKDVCIRTSGLISITYVSSTVSINKI